MGSPSEGGNGNSLQFFCLENPMDRGLWQATVYEVAKESDMTEHNYLVVSLFRFKTKFDKIRYK